MKLKDGLGYLPTMKTQLTRACYGAILLQHQVSNATSSGHENMLCCQAVKLNQNINEQCILQGHVGLVQDYSHNSCTWDHIQII